MRASSIRTICLAAVLSAGRAPDQGNLVFVSSTGELDSDPSLVFDKDEGAIKIDRLAVDSFWGDSINFRGREIRNAHLVDSSIEGLKHLTLETIALRSQDSYDKNGIAIIDGDGVVKTTQQMRWDDRENELKVPRLSSFSKGGLEIRSDVDFTSHKLKNANIEANTSLSELIFKDGLIENSVLRNVTATGLNLGDDVTLESLSVTQFDGDEGSLIVVREGGALEPTSKLKLENDGPLLIDSEVSLKKSLDLNGHDIVNANMRSGSIDGDIDISATTIKAKGLLLTQIQENKAVISDGLAVLGSDGQLVRGNIDVDKRGSLGDIKVYGDIDFVQHEASFDSNNVQGKINGANIVGGTVHTNILSVSGETVLESGLQVLGETYLDGSLTVSGSVLGSGPYVDVSDKRFKSDIKQIDSSEALEKIIQLEGVSYDLDLSNTKLHRRLGGSNAQGRRQLGFLAQDVEDLFPEIVSTDEDGFKGLQYSRFAPLLVEALKHLNGVIQSLQKENGDMRQIIRLMEQRLVGLDD
ncbi:hypothetical protein ACHAWF_011492 [Thalassiosira exigua]